YKCSMGDHKWECVVGYGGSGGSGDNGGSGGNGGDAGDADDADDAVDGNPSDTDDADTPDIPDTPETAVPTYCGNPSDCDPGQVCSNDDTCQVGTCETHGCVNGWTCKKSACEPVESAFCILDSECASLGTGVLCVSGHCTQPADQCTDKTQCPHPDTQNCANGKCVATCTSDAHCPPAFTCNTSLGICTIPESPCTITNDCGSPDRVCIAGACHQRCVGTTDCENGHICTANGCVPDQKPSFLCAQQGVQDDCSAGSICLHHSCYITCTSDPDSCEVNPPFLSICKTVDTSTESYKVCGSDSNLGAECDTSMGKTCTAGKVCIDGYCR
ncbi:MAG: hypothetical protein FWD57_13470, partial [Polyangiaceae bacterium]|nr:hypothetical protein [Polyangiaceae bacterium]